MGATPIIGVTKFTWYIDANKDGIFQASEHLLSYDIIPNDKGVSVGYYYWTPARSLLGRKARLAVSVGFLDPGVSFWDFVDVSKEVTVRGR